MGEEGSRRSISPAAQPLSRLDHRRFAEARIWRVAGVRMQTEIPRLPLRV